MGEILIERREDDGLYQLPINIKRESQALLGEKASI